jgi:hypothetical protein
VLLELRSRGWQHTSKAKVFGFLLGHSGCPRFDGRDLETVETERVEDVSSHRVSVNGWVEFCGY